VRESDKQRSAPLVDAVHVVDVDVDAEHWPAGPLVGGTLSVTLGSGGTESNSAFASKNPRTSELVRVISALRAYLGFI